MVAKWNFKNPVPGALNDNLGGKVTRVELAEQDRIKNWDVR